MHQIINEPQRAMFMSSVVECGLLGATYADVVRIEQSHFFSRDLIQKIYTTMCMQMRRRHTSYT